MWACKRLWLLFFALLYLKDVRALGVWSKRSAQDWYGVAAQIPLAQPEEPTSFHDGAQMSTAMRNEGFQRQNFVSYAQATPNQDVSSPAFQNSYGTPSSMRLQSDNMVYSSLHQQRPQDTSTFQTSKFLMQNASSYSGSRSQTSTGSGLSQGFTSLYAGQSSSPPAFVTLPASVSTVSNHSASSTSSSYSGSQSQGSTVYGLSQGLASQYGRFQTQQGTTQLSSAPGSTVIQQASPSVVSSGSTSSSYSGSQSQGSTIYRPSQGLASQSGRFQTQQGTTQLSSAPGSTVIQQASPSVTSSGSQSPSAYWQSLSSLSNHYVGSQGPQRLNQISSAPGLAVIEQATPSVISSGSTSSYSSSHSGSQSPSTSWQSLSSLSSLYVGSQGQQGLNQLGSVPRLTVIQPASDNVVSNGSATSTSSSQTGSQSQGSTIYRPSQVLASQSGSFQTQQGTNQVSSAPGSTVIQQATPSVVSSGSASSSSSSYTGSQSQTAAGYGLSQWLASYYGSFQTLQNQLSSAPLTVTQQVPEGGMSSGLTTSGISSSSHSGSQSPSSSWLSLGITRPYSSTQHGINQLGSVPEFTVIQPAPVRAVSNGSATSTSSSYSGSQSPSTSWQSLRSLSSQYAGLQGQQGLNQLGSVPGLSVRQQATPSVISSGTTSSSSSSYTGSQSPSTSWLALGLSRPYGSSQTQHGINQLGSVPGVTQIQQATPSGSTSSTSSSCSGSQSPSISWKSLSSLSSRYVGSQGQQGLNQLGSVPRLTVIQPASDNVVFNGSATTTSSSQTGSQSPSTFWLSPGLSRPYGSYQTQHSVNQLGSVPRLTAIQPASDSVVSNVSATTTSSSQTGSQSQGSTVYRPSQGLASQYGRFQTQQGTNQVSSAPGSTVSQQAFPRVTSSGSQSPSAYWQSLSSLSNQYVGSQGLQGLNPISSAPGLAVIQQATPSVISSGSTSSYSSSHSGSQSPSTSWLSLGLSRPYGSSQTQHGINQLGSVPGVTQIQQATPSVTSSGSTSSTSSSHSGSQSPSTSWQSLSSLSSLYVGSQGQQGLNQLGSVPRLTVIQPASDSVVSNVSATSTSSSQTGSQSQGSTIYRPSQGLSSQSGRFQTQQGTNQVSSAPGSTVIQQASPSVVSSGTTSISSLHTGSQSPSTFWLSPGLSKPYGSYEVQHGVNQLGSVPRLTAIQPASDSVVSNGSATSTSSSQTGSQSQGSTIYRPSQGLSSQSGRFQTQQGTNQVSSAPGSTVIQQATPSVVSSGSESPSTYWQSLSTLSNQYVGSQGQQGLNQVSSAPGSTVIRQASPSVVSSGTTSISSFHTGSQHQSTTGYWSSQGLSSHHDGLQTQQSAQQLNQQASSTLTSSHSNVSTSNTNSASQNPSLSQAAGNYLGVQNQNIQKPGAFNQQVPALCIGQYSCKNDFSSSSNISKLS